MRKVNVQQEVRAIARREAHVWRNAFLVVVLWAIGSAVVHWVS